LKLNNMLKPENRLKKMTDFQLLMKNGTWINNPPLSLIFIKLENVKNKFPKRVIKKGKEEMENYEKQLKLAFNVGLKISKSAVKRNRLRRQMRESVRLLIKDKKIKNGYLAMFNAMGGSLDLDYADISQKTQSLLAKSGMLKP